MKALTTLKSALNQSSYIGILALVSLVPVILPHSVLAAELQTFGAPAQIFEIKISDTNSVPVVQGPKQNNNQNSISMQTLAKSDPLVIKLKEYLNKNDSPLGIYSEEIIKQPQWQRALAISYVESHMGKYCFNNNCSGIGGAPGTSTWRKYNTKLDWFIDLNTLLEKPIYKDKYTTFKKMRGVYVQPGSDAWVYGATKKHNELMEITKQAEVERSALALEKSKNAENTPTLLTFAENIK